MTGERKKGWTVGFVLVYSVLLVVITWLSIMERLHREGGKAPVITYAGPEEYILLVVAALTMTIAAIFVYCRGNLEIPSVYVDRSMPLGIASLLTGVAFLFNGIRLMGNAKTIGDYVVTIFFLLSVLFMVRLFMAHAVGGFGGIGNGTLVGSLFPMALYFSLLIQLFFEKTSFYPVIDNVLEQFSICFALLFFLGIGKDIWVSGAVFGRKLMMVSGLLLMVLFVIRMVSPLLLYIFSGEWGSVWTLLWEQIFWIPLTIYAFSTSIYLLRRSL